MNILQLLVCARQGVEPGYIHVNSENIHVLYRQYSCFATCHLEQTLSDKVCTMTEVEGRLMPVDV